MKKLEQIATNTLVESVREQCMRDFFHEHSEPKQLRSCTAVVYECEHWYVLRSYDTIIACIDKNSKRCFDFLRLEYGYTSTSAQHIRKFQADYGQRGRVTTYYVL